MEILVFKLSALGDVLRTTSLIRPLLAKYPKARITWVTSAAALPLLEGNPLLAETMAWEPEAGRRLSGRRFDLVLSLEEDAGIARLIAQSLKAGEVVGVVQSAPGVGYTRSSAPYYDMSLLNRDPDGTLKTADALKQANPRTYVELWTYILRLPRLAPEELRPVLALSEEDRQAAADLRDSLPAVPRPLVGLNPSAGDRWPAKRLGPERAGALCRAFSAAFGAPPLLLGGPEETEYSAFALRAAAGSAIGAGTGHPLRAFAGILDLCDAVVTADSLALHMANALAKPTAVFVGPTSAAELDLFGTGVPIAPPEACRDFYKAACTQAASCLDRITDDTFVHAVEALLRNTPTRPLPHQGGG